MANGEIVRAAWIEYRKWALSSRALKKGFRDARTASLWLGVAGAFLAATAPFVGKYEAAIGALTAALLAIAGFVGKRFLQPEHELQWVKCRLAAETLKRAVWMTIMGVMRPERLQAQVVAIRNVGSQISRADEKKLPDPGIANYLKDRAEGQADYHQSRAQRLRAELGWRRRWVTILGLITVIAGAVGAVAPKLLAAVPVLTAASGAIVALITSKRLDALAALHQDTEVELRMRSAEWKDGDRSDEREFVEDIEEIIARESQVWRTGWLDKNKAAERLEKLRDAAGASA